MFPAAPACFDMGLKHLAYGSGKPDRWLVRSYNLVKRLILKRLQRKIVKFITKSTRLITV